MNKKKSKYTCISMDRDLNDKLGDIAKYHRGTKRGWIAKYIRDEWERIRKIQKEG